MKKFLFLSFFLFFLFVGGCAGGEKSFSAFVGCYHLENEFLDVYEKNQKLYYRVSFGSENLLENSELTFFEKRNNIFQKVRFSDKTFSRFYYTVREFKEGEIFAGLK